MEEEPAYKLIHSVDPRKINVPIREKFAKLTLSNKKKKEEQQTEQQPRQMEKRDSASCNLLSLLNDNSAPAASVGGDKIGATASTTTLGSGPVLSSTQSGNVPFYVNPLLRSSSDGGNDTDETQADAALVQELCEGYVEQHLVSEHSDFMQPLQVSEGFSQLPNREMVEVERQVDLLSQRISILAVSNGVSSEHEPTLLVSTESQRVSCDLLTQRQLQTNANRTVAECILLSSDTDTDAESDDAITVSDSSVSMCSLAAEAAVYYDAVTSDIPHSGKTVDALLPNTFSNEKADRMEAFLRDVSLQCKEMQLLGQETILGEMEELTQKGGVIKDSEERAREMARADTESMSSSGRLIGEERDDFQRLSLRGKAQALTVNDTVPMNESQSVCSAFGRHSILISLDPESVISNGNDSKRLAGDETEANTLVTSAESNTASWANNSHLSHSGNNSFTMNKSRHEVPEDSVVISETSSEVAHSSTSAIAAEKSDEKGSKELVSSEQAITSEENSPATLPSPLSQFQMDIGSINISAKINIKIQISQQADSDNSEDDDDNDDGDSSETGSGVVGDDDADSCDDKADSRAEKKAESSTVENAEEQAAQQRWQLTSGNNLAVKYPGNNSHNSSNSSVSEGEEEDEKFLTHAERLLNQLYGQSWKTPDVIRSLKRTTSGGKLSPSAEKCTPINTAQQTPVCAGRPTNVNVKKSIAKTDAGVEQSILGDFSIFRRNIVKTNLNSTRLPTPKVQIAAARQHPLTAAPSSEPRRLVKDASKQSGAVFKVPQTEVKKRAVVKPVQSRWRQLIDDEADSSGANASDDDSVNETGDSADNNDSAEDGSAHSWSQTSQSSGSSDSEMSPPNFTKNTRKKASTTKVPPKNSTRRAIERRSKQNNELVYLDLSKDEVIVQDGTPVTPPANNDEKFNTRLQDILRTCKPSEKPKVLPMTPTSSGKTKRKLFTANFGVEDVVCAGDDGSKLGTPKSCAVFDNEAFLHDLDHGPVTGGFDVVNKHLEAIKRGTPIFKVTPPRNISTPKRVMPARPKTVDDEPLKRPLRSPKSEKSNENTRLIDRLCSAPHCKYGFLKSLDVRVAKSLCHPDALYYRENFRLRKEELTKIMYELYNEKLFDNKLSVPLVWNKKLCNTAGRCLNKKKLGIRSCVVELSEKVLTSADRLRCTLIHELCHAATWIFHGEGGHGTTWKQWASKANAVFPEIPKIGVCHQYDIEYKYTYKCTLCAAKSHAHSKSKKVENIRCAFCHGAIEIFLNKKDKDGNIMPTPVKEPTGFAKFVKDNYKQYKRPDLKHADIMKILSNEFAALKVAGNGN